MAVLMQKVSILNNNIPYDLAFSILSKLPLKSLKRFECVSKPYSLLLENPYFMKLYRNTFFSKNCSYYDDTSLLIRVDVPQELQPPNSALYLISGERFETKLKLDWPPPPFRDDDNFFSIIDSASVNGTLCLSQNFQRELVLWNPTTKEIKVIPPSPVLVPPYRDPLIYIHGFGYDHIRDDYKVIRWVTFFPVLSDDYNDGVPWECDPEDRSYDSVWEIYSLRNNSWKELDVKMPICDDYLNSVYMDGRCHWLGCNENQQVTTLEFLVSFDLGNEEFHQTSLPSDMVERYGGFQLYLVVLNGFIAVIQSYEETSFHISILAEPGVKESWTKLFIVEPLVCDKYHDYVYFLGVEKRGNIFLRKKDNELAWLDLNSGMIEELGIKGYGASQIVIYKESLNSIALKE